MANPWTDAYVSDMIDRSAARWPGHVALVDGDRRITFQELRERRDGLAGAFARRGIGEGTHVALYLGESWQHVVSIYALLYLGARVVPLNLTWEEREQRYALEHADVEVLVAGTTYRDTDLGARLRTLGLPQAGDAAVGELPKLRSVIGFDRAGSQRGTNWLETLLEEDGPTPPRGTLQTGYLMFTSGSTAFPKGALIRQDAALGTSYHVGDRLGIDPDDRLLNVLPFYHCGGLITAMLGCHQRGAAMYLFEGVDVDRMVETLDREQCNVMMGFDIVNMRLIRAQLETGRPLPIQKIQIVAGATYDELTPLGIHAVLCYALTESSNFVSTTERADDETGRHSNGRPFPGIEVRICDHVTGEPVPVGEPGEICFRGWNQMVGYYHDAERTRSAFDHDGFFHTGDYGWLDDDGRLYYRGRYAMMIKTGGENVSEIEVENFLTAQVPGIANAAVVGVPDDRWGEIVVAFVETADALDPEALRAQCAGKLAKFKIPKQFFAVQPGEWPLTPTGKLVKQTLRDQAAELVAATR